MANEPLVNGLWKAKIFVLSRGTTLLSTEIIFLVYVKKLLQIWGITSRCLQTLLPSMLLSRALALGAWKPHPPFYQAPKPYFSAFSSPFLQNTFFMKFTCGLWKTSTKLVLCSLVFLTINKDSHPVHRTLPFFLSPITFSHFQNETSTNKLPFIPNYGAAAAQGCLIDCERNPKRKQKRWWSWWEEEANENLKFSFWEKNLKKFCLSETKARARNGTNAN